MSEINPVTLQEQNKMGYLYQDFRYFHLRDQKKQEFNYHYHDFYKVVIFVSGNVNYLIEGKTYFLEPDDILLINRFDLHRPSISPDESYERIILWMREDFFHKFSSSDYTLSNCFMDACKEGYHLLRLSLPQRELLFQTLNYLETELNKPEENFAATLMVQTKLLEFLINLNRLYLENKSLSAMKSYQYDKRTDDILRYISQNLTEDLSVETLSTKFYISRYYLMHKFKADTGITLHNYILQKRLSHSIELIKSGVPITKAALECGFNDYSVFFKAFKRQFKCLPSEYMDLDFHSKPEILD